MYEFSFKPWCCQGNNDGGDRDNRSAPASGEVRKQSENVFLKSARIRSHLRYRPTLGQPGIGEDAEGHKKGLPQTRQNNLLTPNAELGFNS